MDSAPPRAWHGLLWLAVAGLSAKGASDVWSARAEFPAWFAPLFAVGTALLLAATVWIAAGRGAPAPISRSRARLVWLLLGVSFVCTTSLHSFHPFRTDVLAVWADWPSLRFNLVLAGACALGVAACWALAAAGRPRAAELGLLALATVLLVPNDDCANPFNAWWIEALGASPLMYLPNTIAILLALAVLRGARPRAGTWLLAAVCATTLALGLGHRTGVVW